MDSLLLVLVSVLGTGLVTGTGAYFVLGRNKLTKKEHNSICEPRMELVMKDISYLGTGQDELKSDVKAIREDVTTLVRRGEGG